MSFVYWLPNADGDWSTLTNWSGGVLPTSADVVTISTSTVHTITHSTGNDFASQFSVGNDLFAMSGGSLTVGGVVSFANTFSMSGGAFSVGGTLAVSGNFNLSGGGLTLASTASVSGAMTQTGGSIQAVGTITVAGAAQLQGGALGGSATLSVGGVTTLSNYAITGNSRLVNAHVADQTGNVTLGDSTGIGAEILNLKGATYNFANAVTLGSGGATATLVNAGELDALSATGTSTINVSTTSTNLILINAGAALAFQGALNTLSGTIQGAGGLAFGGGGNTTIAAGTTLAVNSLSLYAQNTTLTLGGSTTLAGGYSQRDGSVLALGAYTLTVTGAAQFQQYSGTPTVTGTGTLLTQGATTLLGGGTPLVLGGSVTWQNTGNVSSSGNLQIGNGTVAAAMVNAAGAVFNMSAGSISIVNGSAPVSHFTNAGTLEMTANSGGDGISVDVASTGVVSSALSDNLEFDGQINSFAGSLTGAGQISFGAGSTTIAGGTTISVATLALYGAGTNLTFGGAITVGGSFAISNTSTLTLGGNATVAGSFSQSGGATANLGGYTLATTAADSFQYIGGKGTLATKGATALGTATIGGSVAWQNTGTVTQTGNLQIGDNSTSAASLTNAAGAVFNLAASNIRISNGSTPASSLANAGLLAMTANGGTDYAVINVASTGTISVAQGDNFEFDGTTSSFAGSIVGAGQVSFGAGTNTIQAGATISVASLALYNSGTQLVLAGSLSLAGSFSQRDGTTVSLGANTLTLAGAAQFQQYNGAPVVTGTGSLLTKGITTLINGGTALTIGASAVWTNSGTIVAGGNVLLGNGSAAAATLNNLAGGIYDIVGNGVAVSNGSTPVSTFTNAGLLEMTSNSGTGYVSADLTSTGTISVALGDNLEIDAPAGSLAGSLIGAGQLSFGAGASTIAVGTTISVATLALYNNGTSITFAGAESLAGGLSISSSSSTLTLSGATTVAGAFFENGGSVTMLAGASLTLSGAAQFQQYYSTPTFNGGSLVTKGVTTLVAGGTALVLGAGGNWTNAGTIAEAASLQLGSGSTAASRLTNQAGAVLNLTSGNITIANGSTPVSALANAGLLEMTANSGGSTVGVDFSNTGTIAVSLGDNLEFDGPVNSVAGSLTGAGQISFGNGSTTIAAGTAITVATLAIYGPAQTTVVTLGGNVTVSGGFSQRDASTVALGANTLTLAGAAQFQYYYGGPVVTGTGTLLTKGTTTLVSGNTALTIGGGATWSNTGKVLASGSVLLGNSLTASATLANQAGGVFDFIGTGLSINSGSTPASSLSNAGLLEMTNIGGSDAVNVAVANSGTILAQGGSLGITGAITGTGLLEVTAGGTLGVSGAVASTQSMKFLDATSELSINLPTPTSFGASITGFVKGDTIDLTNVSNATATFSGGKLTFTDNTSHAVVAVLAFTNAPNFTFASDGRSGTLIGDPPPSAAAAGLTDRAYFTNVGGGAEIIAITGQDEKLIGGFSYGSPDRFDLSKILAGTPVVKDMSNIGKYLTSVVSGGNTTLYFDAAGRSHGLGAAVAMLTNTNTTVADLLAHHALLS